jgi:RNA polymerase sigma factor (sigma-70 family)
MTISTLRRRTKGNPERPAVRPTRLCAQVVSGTADDNTRFKAVVTPHVDEAYRLAYWLTGNRTDAEDVVQNAFLRAFRAMRNYAGGTPRAWLLTIVRNAAYSWLRKKRRSVVVAVENLEAVELEHASREKYDDDTPEASLIAKVNAQQLREAIANLPTPFRETLSLRDIEGLDYLEIAQVTEVPIGTVMSRLARARHRLISALKTNEKPNLFSRHSPAHTAMVVDGAPR